MPPYDEITKLIMCSIESMKMETVIRSPQDGIIKKLAHKAGVSNFRRCQHDHSLISHRIFARRALYWFNSRRMPARRSHEALYNCINKKLEETPIVHRNVSTNERQKN